MTDRFILQRKLIIPVGVHSQSKFNGYSSVAFSANGINLLLLEDEKRRILGGSATPVTICCNTSLPSQC